MTSDISQLNWLVVESGSDEHLIDEIFVGYPMPEHNVRAHVTSVERAEKTTLLYDDPEDYLLEE